MCLSEITENKKKGRVKIFHVQENIERAHVINSNRVFSFFLFFPGLNYPGNYVISLLCLQMETKIVGLVGKVKHCEREYLSSGPWVSFSLYCSLIQ